MCPFERDFSRFADLNHEGHEDEKKSFSRQAAMYAKKNEWIIGRPVGGARRARRKAFNHEAHEEHEEHEEKTIFLAKAQRTPRER